MPLDVQGQKLLSLLVERLNTVVTEDPRTYVSYREVHEHLRLRLRGPTYGVSLQFQGLNSLGNWTVENNMPGITGLIIDRGTLLPGEGYFLLFHRNQDDFVWWKEQIRLSKEFDWSPYLAVCGKTHFKYVFYYDKQNF